MRAFRYQAVIAFVLGCGACTIHPEDRDALNDPERVESTPRVAVPIGAALAAPVAAPIGAALAAPLNLTQYVNPFIGTDDSNSPNPVPAAPAAAPTPDRCCRSAWCSSARTRRRASPSGYRSRDTHDRGLQPDPLRRRGLPQQRGPPHPADHRGARRLPRHVVDQLRVGLHQGQRVGGARVTTSTVLDKLRNHGGADRHARTGVFRLTYPRHHERAAADQHQPQRDRQPQPAR